MLEKKVGEEGKLNVERIFPYPGDAFNSSAHVGLKGFVRGRKGECGVVCPGLGGWLEVAVCYCYG